MLVVPTAEVAARRVARCFSRSAARTCNSHKASLLDVAGKANPFKAAHSGAGGKRADAVKQLSLSRLLPPQSEQRSIPVETLMAGLHGLRPS